MKIASIRAFLRTLLIEMIERVSLTFFLCVYAAVIILLAFIYCLLPPSEGLVSSNDSHFSVSFGSALYFSITTVTTLGYGDIIPVGFARVLACFEAFFGLSMLGIILAKITSARLSYHVLRLFGSDAQNRLEAFNLQFDRIAETFSGLTSRIKDNFQETPGKVPPPTQGAFVVEFAEAIRLFHSRSLNFCRYLATEVKEGFFFSDAPTTSLAQAGDSVCQTIFVLTQALISLSPQARITVLDVKCRRHIKEALNGWQVLSREMAKRADDPDLKKSFEDLEGQCTELSESYFSVPIIMEEPSQPDQLLGAADQPQ
jgi:hypothetical protein